MLLILFYSALLILGILCSQLFDLTTHRHILGITTEFCLAYIMMEVGLHFSLDKTKLKSYGWDFLFAFLAAALPWILCAFYFMAVLKMTVPAAFLVGVFAAPTSAGVLFAMLAAAGLGTTWVFRKAQVLAVFDDFDVILILIPLQMVFVGWKPELLVVVIFVVILLASAYRWLHKLHLPNHIVWLLVYSVGVVLLAEFLANKAHIKLGVLLPAFAFGAMLYHRTHGKNNKEEKTLTPPGFAMIDGILKASFMFLVGSSLPKIEFGETAVGVLILHVVALTILSNLGKCFLLFCYRHETTFKQRAALSVAMFPRGEVGAGVLFVAMSYGIVGLGINLGVLSLALNLILTGFFITIVIRLLR